MLLACETHLPLVASPLLHVETHLVPNLSHKLRAPLRAPTWEAINPWLQLHTPKPLPYLGSDLLSTLPSGEGPCEGIAPLTLDRSGR